MLAYWLRLLRVQRGWSQERLAMECELDRTYVSAVERRRWNVSLANLDRFAQALEVPAWRLLVPPQHYPKDWRVPGAPDRQACGPSASASSKRAGQRPPSSER